MKHDRIPMHGSSEVAMLGDLDLAIIGCGAIADSYYFPVLSADASAREKVWLVEPSAERREKAAAAFGFRREQLVGDIVDLPATVTAAVNATPSHLHVATTLPLIERGVNVIIEKPLAETADDARQLVTEARGRSVLTANQYRRFCPSYRLAREIIEAGEIGDVRSIKWAEGQKFEWPTQSGFYFRRPWKTGRPRGVLLDIGVHVLDVVCWWLGDTPRVVSASMDGFGGPECFARAELAFGDVEMDLAVSIHSKLANGFVVEGTKGAIRGSVTDFSTIEIRTGSGGWQSRRGPGPSGWTDFAEILLRNFAAAVEGREALLVDAESVVAPLQAVDAIYEAADSPLPSYYREWAS
jgi:predicted dehydrogenase